MKQIVIDADTDVDDSLATPYALRLPDFHAKGITTCFGNDSAEQSAGNCLRLIRPSGCGYEVPAAVGSNESLDGMFGSAPAHIHGDNGIDNAELPESSQRLVDETAQDFIIRRAGELKDELTIITAGRMTNLACALEKDPKSPSKVKRVVAMDGTLKGPGNVNPYAEANTHGDAKAADRVFRAGFNLTLVGLGVTVKTFIADRDAKNLRTYCREECKTAVDYVRDVPKFYFEFHWVSTGMAKICVAHDPLAVFIVEDPSLGVFRMVRAGVEYEHEPFRGMIRTDTEFVPILNREEIVVYVEVDSEKAVRRLFSLFQDTTPGRYNRRQER